MKAKIFGMALVALALATVARADDITTLDGRTYNNVHDVAVHQGGLYFVYGSGADIHGTTIGWGFLPQDIKDKYHYDPYALGLGFASLNQTVDLNRNMAFTLDQLDRAMKAAKAQKKLIGFVMEWDQFFVPSKPMESGSNSGLADFYDVFHNGMILVFVRHESELDKVPDAVKQGFNGPEEGGFAPNMCVVSSDCSQFVCEIPYGGDKSDGDIREHIFRDKIEIIKKFEKDMRTAK